MSSQIKKYLLINESGDLFIENENSPVTSIEAIQNLLRNLKLTPQFTLETHLGSDTTPQSNDETYFVEAVDHPLIANKISVAGSKVLVETQYQLIFEADIHKFSLDPFDRICGLTTTQAPFRLTAKAQDRLFDECDEFDDDSFTLNGLKIFTPEYYFENSAIADSDFWTQVYQKENIPGWDLGEPANAFKDMLPRIKLPKSRILVLGCGEGHDAALFAQAGHVVTAIDFSAEAIRRAKTRYGYLENIEFIELDIFKIPNEWNYTFDVIIEHTCFCAIEPKRRKDMIKLWRRLLHEEGQLMGVFFAMLKRAGPPYGSSEWEIRELLKNDFQFLFWTRWRKSIPRREARELFVLAKKRPS